MNVRFAILSDGKNRVCSSAFIQLTLLINRSSHLYIYYAEDAGDDNARQLKTTDTIAYTHGKAAYAAFMFFKGEK